MTARSPWFRCNPSRLLGALGGMSPDQGYLYTVILMRIYETGGPIGDDVGVLCRRTGLSCRKVEAALAWLADHDKVQRLDNGLLDSSTTHEELSYREKHLIDARNAGKESARRKHSFPLQKTQTKQQNTSTDVDVALNGRSTQWQRSLTDIDIDKDIEANASINRRSAPRRAARLTRDWKRTQSMVDYALAQGMTRADVEREAEAMRDWSLQSPNGAKLDWEATWRSWVRRWEKNRPQKSNGGSVSAALGRLQEKLEAAECVGLELGPQPTLLAIGGGGKGSALDELLSKR